MTKNNVRHIIQYLGETQGGHSKYRVTTVSKMSKDMNSNSKSFHSWDSHNTNITFHNFKIRPCKGKEGIIVYDYLGLIEKAIKREYGETTEMFKI